MDAALSDCRAVTAAAAQAEAESPGLQSTSSLQSASTGPEGEPGEEDRQSNHSC